MPEPAESLQENVSAQPDGSNKILFFPQRPRWVQNSFQKDFALFTHARFVTNLKDQLEFKGARGS